MTEGSPLTTHRPMEVLAWDGSIVIRKSLKLLKMSLKLLFLKRELDLLGLDGDALSFLNKFINFVNIPFLR